MLLGIKRWTTKTIQTWRIITWYLKSNGVSDARQAHWNQYRSLSSISDFLSLFLCMCVRVIFFFFFFLGGGVVSKSQRGQLVQAAAVLYSWTIRKGFKSAFLSSPFLPAAGDDTELFYSTRKATSYLVLLCMVAFCGDTTSGIRPSRTSGRRSFLVMIPMTSLGLGTTHR